MKTNQRLMKFRETFCIIINVDEELEINFVPTIPRISTVRAVGKMHVFAIYFAFFDNFISTNFHASRKKNRYTRKGKLIEMQSRGVICCRLVEEVVRVYVTLLVKND